MYELQATYPLSLIKSMSNKIEGEGGTHPSSPKSGNHRPARRSATRAA
jgi:hypothetical protein